MMSPLLSSSAFLVLLLPFSSDADAGSGAAAHYLRSRSLILVKVWCLILVFVGTFVGGVSPYFFKWNEGFLVLGTQFAGGVFLGTALMHFLSDSNETFQDLNSIDYPFAFMLACAGYSLTMLADCLIASVYSRRDRRDDRDPIAATSTGDSELQGTVAVGGGKSGSTVRSAAPVQGIHGHGQDAAPLAGAASLGDSILLICALCFHSVFEGIAIGVAETEAEAWRALWTVSLHKIFAAIAMGIALLRMIPNRPLLSCAAYAFAFAISTPIGVAVGIIIDATTQGVVADWIYAISMGLACGIFIYVSINHLFIKGYTPVKRVVLHDPVYKFLAVLLGIGVIAVVMIWD